MNKKGIILTIILIISIIINILLFFTIAYIDSEWSHDYEELNVIWCTVSNEEIEIINDLIIELQYYDSVYAQIELINKTDCWE